MHQQTILALFAHPDDEAFGTGSTLATYAAAGAEVVLVCATRGEVGEIADPALATPETLGEVREGELRCAVAALGLSDLILLNYRDSGMVGTAENADPRAFVNAPAEDVISQLVGIIRRLKPQVLITFDPNGGYGHPDHIAIHTHTVAAFAAAGDATRYPDQGPAWQPARLFYSVFPRATFLQMREQMQAAGIDTSQMDRFEESDIGWPDDQVDVTLDVSAMLDAKWQAMLCHATQFGPDNFFRRLPDEVTKSMFKYEYFAQALPPREQRAQLVDLFGGLDNSR